MGKTLILKDASVDWEQYYSENMRNSSIDVETPYKKMGKMGDFICHVFMHFDFLGFSFFFGGWKKDLKSIIRLSYSIGSILRMLFHI